MLQQDQQMIDLISKKKYEGLDLLIDSYGDQIVQTVHAILSRPTERGYCSEAINDTLYKIWQKISSFDDQKSSFKTWITTIAKRTAIDMQRMIQRNEQRLLSSDPLEFLVEETTAPFEKEHFITLIRILSESDQLIFLKHYFYQETPAEIAMDLHLPTQIVYARLSRGRKKLKRKWGEQHD